MKRLRLGYYLLIVALMAILAAAGLATRHVPVEKLGMPERARLDSNGRPGTPRVLLTECASAPDDAPPDGRLVSVKTSLVGSRDDYLTELPLKDVGMFYLSLFPRHGRLVRAVTGGRLLWFAEFEESSGDKVFVTVRAGSNDISPGSGAGKTKVSIVRIAAKVN